MRRDESGVILFEEMKSAIELADTIEQLVWLEGVIKCDFVYRADKCLELLRDKEKQIKSLI